MSARVEIYRQTVTRFIGAGTRDDVYRPSGTRLGKWRWRFVSNGRIMADSGQDYSRRIDCLNGCARVLGARVDGDTLNRYDLGKDVWPAIPVVDLTRRPSADEGTR